MNLKQNNTSFYWQDFKKWLKNPTLLRDYYYFSLIIIFTFLFLSFYISRESYLSHKNEINHQLELEATLINRELKDIFKDTTEIVKFLGKDISKNNNPDDLDHIYAVLRKGSDVEIHAIEYLTGVSNFDWVNKQGYQLINMMEGITTPPHDMRSRKYVEECAKSPWRLHLSQPTFGVPSGFWVLPGGVGITDEKGKYIGIIGLGFAIEEVANRLKQQLKLPYTNFIILDDRHEFVMNSYDNSPQSFKSLKKYFSGKKFDFSKKKGTVSNIIVNNFDYSYYYNLSDYPYIILVGWDRRIMDAKFYSFIIPRVLEFLGFGIFCASLIYFFRKKIINPISNLSQAAVLLSTGQTKVKIPRQSSLEMHNLAKALLQVMRYIKRNEFIHHRLKQAYDLANTSDEAKEEFLRRINNELKKPLHFILWYSDILIKFLKEEIHVNLPISRQVEILIKIQEAGSILHTLTTNILNLSYVDVNSVIEYCLKVEAKSAFLKNIKLDFHLQKNLPPLYADELRLKQIMVGLISLSIDYTYDGGNIVISNALEIKERKKLLKINIEDDGFAFGKEDIRRLSDSISKKSVSRALDSTDLDLELIEKLVKMHEGMIEIISLGEKGKRIILTFPYRDQKSTDICPTICSDFDKNHYIKDNVYKIY